MDYTVYKLLHYLGIALLLVAIGGVCIHAVNSDDKKSNTARRLVLVMHGLGTFLILLGGFGMLAKIDEQGMGFPGWLWPKLIIWFALAASVGLPYKDRRVSLAIVVAAPILVLLSAYFAIFKPF